MFALPECLHFQLCFTDMSAPNHVITYTCRQLLDLYNLVLMLTFLILYLHIVIFLHQELYLQLADWFHQFSHNEFYLAENQRTILWCQSFEQKRETGIDIARCPDITHEVEEMILSYLADSWSINQCSAYWNNGNLRCSAQI